MVPQAEKKNQGTQDHPESSKRTKFLAAQKQSPRIVKKQRSACSSNCNILHYGHKADTENK